MADDIYIRLLEKRVDLQGALITTLQEDLVELRENLAANTTSRNFLEKSEDRAYGERTKLRDSYMDLSLKISALVALVTFIANQFLDW